MKNISVFIVIIGLAVLTKHTSAHAIWLETKSSGIRDKEHQVHIYYGEYSYGIKEKPTGEAFEKVKNFKLWLVDPKGNKTVLNAAATDSCYSAFFTPDQDGLYAIMLYNNEIEVIDYTQYNFGIFKTHYHAVAKVMVGKASENSMAAENSTGLAIVDKSTTTREVNLCILYNDKPLADCEVEIFLPEQWKKSMKTDENGRISFKTPWKATYLVEATRKEEVPGTYNGQDYEFIWHCVTYAILSK